MKPKCPVCNKPMRYRKPKVGGSQQFKPRWVCSDYDCPGERTEDGTDATRIAGGLLKESE